MARWTDLHNPLRGYNLDPELHAHYMLLYVTKKLGKEVLNLQRRSWTDNVFTRQRKAQYSQETPL